MAKPPDEISMSPTSLDRYIEQSAHDYVDKLIARTVKDLQTGTCNSCHQFMSVIAGECLACDKLVDLFVSQTMFKVQQEFCSNCTELSRKAQRIYEFNEDYKIQDFSWGTIEDFNVDLGKKMIEDYIKTWDYDVRWLYYITFLRREDFQFDNRYRYQVCWSIPTRCKPIPRATASIFFTFLLSKIKPKIFPVEVFFVLETNRLVHRPGESRFREEWLKDIIESKILLVSSIVF